MPKERTDRRESVDPNQLLTFILQVAAAAVWDAIRHLGALTRGRRGGESRRTARAARDLSDILRRLRAEHEILGDVLSTAEVMRGRLFLLPGDLASLSRALRNTADLFKRAEGIAGRLRVASPNDEWTHPAFDELLDEIGRSLSATVRESPNREAMDVLWSQVGETLIALENALTVATQGPDETPVGGTTS